MSARYILRVDGTREDLLRPTSIAGICKLIGADCIDTVILSWHQNVPQSVMIVDDTGLIDGKPINPQATRLYHSICRAGTTNPICGDVAVVPDEDFV